MYSQVYLYLSVDTYVRPHTQNTYLSKQKIHLHRAEVFPDY